MILDWLHQPKYTGENRCTPCTIINSSLAILASAVISRISKNGGRISFVLFTALIYSRGYLIPGTPEFTQKYLPNSVLQYFEHHPPIPNSPAISDSSTDSKSSYSIDETAEPEKFLMELDVVRECENQDDLCLTTEFEQSWDDEIQKIDDSEITTEKLSDILNLTGSDQTLIELDDGFALEEGNSTIGHWPSRGALIADIATAELLSHQYPLWEQVSPNERLSILRSVRVFVSYFPTTGASVTISEETLESCCRSVDVVAIQCSETGQRLIEQPIE